jgi:hypothetical protein
MPTVYYVFIVREGADGAGELDYYVIQLQEMEEDGSYSKQTVGKYHNKENAIAHVMVLRGKRDEQPV